VIFWLGVFAGMWLGAVMTVCALVMVAAAKDHEMENETDELEESWRARARHIR